MDLRTDAVVFIFCKLLLSCLTSPRVRYVLYGDYVVCVYVQLSVGKHVRCRDTKLFKDMTFKTVEEKHSKLHLEVKLIPLKVYLT